MWRVLKTFTVSLPRRLFGRIRRQSSSPLTWATAVATAVAEAVAVPQPALGDIVKPMSAGSIRQFGGHALCGLLAADSRLVPVK